MSFSATWMDLAITILSEVSQTEKDKRHTIILTCGIQNDTNELMYKTETDSQTKKSHLRLPKRSERRDKLGLWD